MQGFFLGVSDCEELVGVAYRGSKWCDTNLLPPYIKPVTKPKYPAEALEHSLDKF